MEFTSNTDSHTFSYRTYKIAIALFLGGAAIDIATTFYGVTNFSTVKEGNPIVEMGMEIFGPLAGLFLVKAILIILMLALLTKLSVYTRRDKYTLIGLASGLIWGLAGMINFYFLFLF